MAQPIVIDVPHTLEKERIRNRLKNRIGDLPGLIPGGLAQVQSDWPSEDQMALHVDAMGQHVHAVLDIMDQAVRVTVDLPPGLTFMRGMIEGAVRKQASALVEDKRT